MTVSQCKCHTSDGLSPSKDKVHCDWCGITLFHKKFTKEQVIKEMRSFSGGATRSPQEGKPEFAGFLSPVVIRRFGEYMLKHQKQEDGKLRSASNWKKGMPRIVYFESMFRHFVDVWEEVTQDLIKPNEGGTFDRAKLEEALCAMLFNVQGLLREVMLGRDVGEDV